MGRPKYGAQTHFVKWDENKSGGRWYECTITSAGANGKHAVTGHEGSKEEFFPSQLTEIGHDTTHGDSTPHIAYWQSVPWYDTGYDYAFLCTVQMYNKRKRAFWVKYHGDDSEEYVPEDQVFKVVRLD